MVTTEHRRQVVTHLVAAFAVSARRAMRVIGLSRSRWHYVPERPLRDAPIRERLKALAQARPRFGYKRLHVLLRREGVVVNRKRVYRLYREEHLAVRRRHGRKHAAEPRGLVVRPTQPTERWGMDFIHDACVDGRRLDFIRPGKPVDNAYIESFHSRFRDECLAAHWFLTLADARFQIEQFRRDYNDVRPHSSLGNLTPREFTEAHTTNREPPTTRLSA